MLRLADHQPGRLTPVLEILRRQTDRREGKDLALVANRGVAVDDRGRANLAVPPECHVRPDDGMRPDDGSGSEPGRRVDVRGRIDSRVVIDGQHEIGFGHDLTIDSRGRLGADNRAALPVERDLEAQPIARHHLLAELGVLDAAQQDPAVAHEQRRDLRQRLDHQHARHQRHPGKVPLEELFVDGDVLDRDDPATRFELRDLVHQ